MTILSEELRREVLQEDLGGLASHHGPLIPETGEEETEAPSSVQEGAEALLHWFLLPSNSSSSSNTSTKAARERRVEEETQRNSFFLLLLILLPALSRGTLHGAGI